MRWMEEIKPETAALLEEAWRVREANFPPEIEMDYPKNTEVISLTGRRCAMNCAHCGGHYLDKMTPVSEVFGPRSRKGASTTSCLISGGCDPDGKLPLDSHYDLLRQLHLGRKLNFHVGLVSSAEIDAIKDLADAVSFDFVGDDATIREVFGLDRTVEDYRNTYRLLRQKVKVLPHICIGLKGGEIAGEYRALDILHEEGVSGLVFIVFIPTSGTRYEDRQPPSLVEVISIIASARLRFPQIPIHLGCMRPKGQYRARLDELAVRAGVNKIVNPTPGAVRLAGQLGLELIRGEECCVL